MIKKTFITILFSSLFSCNYPAPNGERKTVDNYNIVVIDGCEYIEYDKGMSEMRVYSLTHKGNCSNHSRASYIK